ncbi:hypothetical protein SAMN05518669_103419 [Variovorax sp. YR634]|uniref:hypothetical protein n=1 Tax=Variovorax sp. YR634 TaxID=1884385 RepID=UPI00089D2677|nr:hypothetical protein [Variovorax sp. YR634]SDX15478.1 hypothetical protein SAMN05518669_103419 [Variovorax sp. YR634]
MHPDIKKPIQTATGPRNVLEGEYKGTKIEVVSGYDVTHDNWPFHVYLIAPDGQKARLFDVPSQHRANSLNRAFEQGMQMAVQHLTPRDGGFQREVKI